MGGWNWGGNCARHGQLGQKIRFYEAGPTKSRMGEQERGQIRDAMGKPRAKQQRYHTDPQMWKSKEGLMRLGTREKISS